MKSVAIPGLVLLSALALAGCDSNNSKVTQQEIDQAAADTAVARTEAVIDRTGDVSSAESESIDQIDLPTADTAEPVAISDPNASL